MKLIYRTTISLLFILLGVFSACNTTKLQEVNSKGNGTKAEVSLGAIMMAAETKAESSNMPTGATFRLYAFEKGKTDISDVLTTRTYTIGSTAGTPVLDSEQDVLYLPVGEVDVYLVGPVQSTIKDQSGIKEITVDVATEMGVFPTYGVDLIASKSTVNITAGKVNSINLEPLSHKMARMDIEISRKEDALYVNLLVKEIKIYNQSTVSDFAFGENGGSVTPTSGSADIVVKDITEEVKGDKYTAMLYMIPRQLDEMKIEVNFTCNLKGSSEKLDKRLESGLINAELVGGKRNLFWSNPVISSNILWRTKILPWNEVKKDDILIPKDENIIFDYSGLDAPIIIDGEKYWPDRSGNGRHARIVGDMRYDEVRKCYMSSTTNTSYFALPELERLTEYTIEITLESSQNPAINMVRFFDPLAANERSLNIHLPYGSNTVYFDAGGIDDGKTRMLYQFFPKDRAFMENFATYYFSRNKSNLMVIGRNGKNAKTATLNGVYGEFKNNSLFECDYNGTPALNERLKMRLYSVRMYKTATTEDIAKQHYEADMATYCGFHTKGDDSEYIKDGLILNLDGTTRGTPITQWNDLSGFGNHAKIAGGTIPISDNKGYNFGGNLGAYMQLTNSLGRMQNFTVEFVAKTSSNNIASTLLHFSNSKTGDTRVLHIHYPWTDGYSYFDSPHVIPGLTDTRAKLKTSGLPYSVTDINSCSVSREYDKEDGLKITLNGIFAGAVKTYPELLPEMKYCYLGKRGTTTNYYPGIIYAVRVYNRVLTEKEKQHNYLVDKKKYSIL